MKKQGLKYQVSMPQVNILCTVWSQASSESLEHLQIFRGARFSGTVAMNPWGHTEGYRWPGTGQFLARSTTERHADATSWPQQRVPLRI